MKPLIGKFLVALVVFTSGGCFFVRHQNDQATERLRVHLVNEEFEKVADEAYPALTDYPGRDDVIRQLRDMTNELKEIDPEIRWERSAYVPGESSDDDETNFSAVDVIGKGKKVTLIINWMDSWRLCGFGIIRDKNVPDRASHGFHVCD